MLDQVVEKIQKFSPEEQEVIVNRILSQLKVLEKNSEPIKAAIAPLKNSKVVIKYVNLLDNVKAQNQFIKPDKDCRFLCLQIIIDNLNGEEEYQPASSAFKLKDSEGNQYKIVSSVAMEPILRADEIDAGDIEKGWITYNLPTEISLEDLRVRYEFCGKKTDWISLAEIKNTVDKNQ